MIELPWYMVLLFLILLALAVWGLAWHASRQIAREMSWWERPGR